jgi:prefoldin subunit 5
MTRIKFTALGITLISLTLLFSSPVFAQNTLTAPKAKITSDRVNAGTSSATINLPPLENLRNRAVNEIDRRIAALTQATSRLGLLKHLSDTVKSTLTTLVRGEIESLTALKAKIQAETDLATLRTDAKSIVVSHRIFALFLPQVRLLATADKLLQISDKTTELSVKLQARIATAKAAGNNTVSLETLLAGMNQNIESARTNANEVITAVTPLTPDGYPANRTALLSAKQNLQAGHKSLKDAIQDARKIIEGLKAFSNNEKSGTESSIMIPDAPTSQ